MKGFSASKIEGKMGLRMTQNADLKFDNVFIPMSNKLEFATDFEKSTKPVLLKSRIGTGWIAAGGAAGAYELCLKYCLERKQFGKPIAAFQLNQERLSRMLANCELSLSLLIKLNSALDNGDFKVKMGQASRAKASITKLARETVALARESMGGNGILLENGVIRHMMDTEVYYTYEGSYDINSLISGKEITGGLSAFV